jgi:hypothetical protein
MADPHYLTLIGDVPVTLGLSAKKRARVAALLAEGRTWPEIGRDVGWEPNTLREFYEARKEGPERG